MKPAWDGKRDILRRIEAALQAACSALAPFTPGRVAAEYKSRHNPVTEADRILDRLLREKLQHDGEGWLSEESVDDKLRLRFDRVWVVDPLDGTAEFVAGIPEWCVSVGFVQEGSAVAGGICNPMTGEIFLGARNIGVTYNGAAARAGERKTLDGALALASRSEFNRGEWQRFEHREFTIRPLGSIAYKLALVAAGKADATWTFNPKHEWDIAAGAALVEAAGGFVTTIEGSPLVFNNPEPRLSGLIAGHAGLVLPLTQMLSLNRAAVSSDKS